MSPELQKPAKKLPPGYTEFPDTGVAYKMYKKNKIWGEAKKYCTGEGANLAVIDSFQKIEYVMDLRGPDQIDVHVGIHRFFDDNEWVEIRTGKIVKTFRKMPNDSFKLRVIFFNFKINPVDRLSFFRFTSDLDTLEKRTESGG